MWWALLVLGCSAPSDTFIKRPVAYHAVVAPDGKQVLRFARRAELLELPTGEKLGSWDAHFGDALIPADGGAPVALSATLGLMRLEPNGVVDRIWTRDDGYPSRVEWATMAWVGHEEREVVLSGSRWLNHRYDLESGAAVAGVVPAQPHLSVILPETGESVSRERSWRDRLYGWSAVEERDLWELSRELDAHRAFSSRYPSEGTPENPAVQLELSPDGEKVATAGHSEVVNIVAPLDAFVTAYLTPPWIEVVTSVDWSASGAEVLVGYGDGRAAVFDADSGEVLWTGNSRDSLYAHGELQEWGTQKAKRLRDLFPLPVLAMGLQADGTVVVAHRLGVHSYPGAVVRP